MCATPIHGHLAPMMTIGRHLVSTGHQVRMLTGSRFTEAVKAAGIEPIPLPASCDSGADSYASFTQGAELTGLRKLRFDVENIFVGVMTGQYEAVRSELARDPADVVIEPDAAPQVAAGVFEARGAHPADLAGGVNPPQPRPRGDGPAPAGRNAPGTSRTPPPCG